MTLEQRVLVLEKAIANMAAQQHNAEILSEMLRNSTSEAIKNACRPGWVLNAAQKQTTIEITKADGATAVRLGKI